MISYYSILMRIFMKIGMNHIAWSLRRLYCPVKKSDLVLEIGSGGNPYARANVLSDAYYGETRERHYKKIVLDRPMVVAFAENLPFKDDSFDFIIASHVIEHSTDPGAFIEEIQRVAKAGYIEAPDGFMERLTGYLDHRLEVSSTEGKLYIRKKENYKEELSNSSAINDKSIVLYQTLINSNPFDLHVRYYWKKEPGIDYEILNPDYQFDWVAPNTKNPNRRRILSAVMKQKILQFLRKLISQNNRNKNIDLISMLQCPNCSSKEFIENESLITCKECRSDFKLLGKNIIEFTGN